MSHMQPVYALNWLLYSKWHINSILYCLQIRYKLTISKSWYLTVSGSTLAVFQLEMHTF